MLFKLHIIDLMLPTFQYEKQSVTSFTKQLVFIEMHNEFFNNLYSIYYGGNYGSFLSSHP